MVRTYDTGCCGSTDQTAPSTVLIVLAGSFDVRTTRNEYLSGVATCVSGTYTAGFMSYSNPRSRMSRTTPAIVHHGFLVSSSLSPNFIRLPTALLPGQCRLAKNSLMTITRASSATFRKNARVFSLVSYFVLGIGTAIVSR